MRHNLEASAGTTEMRSALYLGWLAGRMADGSRCGKDAIESEFKQRKAVMRQKERQTKS